MQAICMQCCFQIQWVIEDAVHAFVMCVVSIYAHALLLNTWCNCVAMEMSVQRVAGIQQNGKIPGNPEFLVTLARRTTSRRTQCKMERNETSNPEILQGQQSVAW